eukprot:Hpha_TRINITY_DN16820_c1_g1::TRINITY_DN16820_c1_g1_i1::g.151419::m.151419
MPGKTSSSLSSKSSSSSGSSFSSTIQPKFPPAQVLKSSSGSFSSTLKPKSPPAKAFMIPTSQCVIARADDLVKDVMGLLVRNNFARRRCYVLDNDNRCVGKFGLKSIARAWYEGNADPDTLKMRDVMLQEFSFCSEDTSLDECRGIMGRERVHYIVVTKNGDSKGEMLGAMTTWMVATEQATEALPYPHNKLARSYNVLYKKLSPDQLSLHPKL